MNKIVMIVGIIIVSCTNPFDTRDPNLPETSVPIQPISNLQNDPDSLFRQLQLAFEEPNWNYYEALIVDHSQFNSFFIFIPQPDAAYRIQGWTREDELNYFRKLIQDKNRNQLQLQIFNIEGPVQIGSSQDTLQTRFSYQIEIKDKLEKEFYKGQGIFRIFRSQQSLWYIYYWEDLKPPSGKTDSTWSVLKANYR